MMQNEKLTRRRFLQITGLSAASAAFLAACPAPGSAPADDGGGSAPDGDSAVEVTAWAHWEQGLQWLQDSMDNYGFADENPNITLNQVVAPNAEIHDKMLAACASGVGQPDIMRVEQGRAASFFKGDVICYVDLTDLIGDRMDDLVLGSAVDYWSWQGKIYGIGNEVNACTLAYRESVFNDIGIETPFETWQDFREAGVALKAETGMNAISWHDQNMGDFQMMLFAAGGLIFDADGNLGGLNDLGKEILEFQRSTLHDDEIAMVAPVTGDSSWSPPIYWESFRQDQLAATIGAPWHNGKLGREDKIGIPEQSGQWKLQRLPGGFGDNLPTATHGGTSVSIPTGAEHPEEAWAIIEFTHLTEAVLEDAIQRGITPSYKPVLSDPVLNEPYDYYGGQVIGELYQELAEGMPRIYQSPWAPEFTTAFTDMVLTPVIQGNNGDFDALFAELTPELERLQSL